MNPGTMSSLAATVTFDLLEILAGDRYVPNCREVWKAIYRLHCFHSRLVHGIKNLPP